jgi:hypothetical protein
MPDQGLAAPSPDFGEARVLLDLEAPTLVLTEVPVEAVQLVQREQVDELLHEGKRHEVPAAVEHRAAPPEARLVLNQHGRSRPVDAHRL